MQVQAGLPRADVSHFTQPLLTGYSQYFKSKTRVQLHYSTALPHSKN